MGSFSWWHWLIVLLVVLLLFGGGKKIPELLKGLGTGIKGFKKAVRDDDDESDMPKLDTPMPAQPTQQTIAKSDSKEIVEAKVVASQASINAPVSAPAPQVVRLEVSTAEAPKKRGRPKGSTNKPKDTSSKSPKSPKSSKEAKPKKSTQTKAKKSSETTKAKSTKSTK